MMAEEKRRIRAQIRARLAAIAVPDRIGFAQRACDILIREPAWKNARTIMGYLALPDEIDIGHALRLAWEGGKQVGLPRYLPDKGVYGAAEYRGELTNQGAFGIREPGAGAPEVPLKRLDLVLVPGVAFDHAGGRLGRGKGFFDRLLAEVTGLKCGVALDEQLVEQVPAELHDISMDFILTPTRWMTARLDGR